MAVEKNQSGGAKGDRIVASTILVASAINVATIELRVCLARSGKNSEAKKGGEAHANKSSAFKHIKFPLGLGRRFIAAGLILYKC